MKALFQKIRRILRDRRTRQMLTRIISVTAAVVVFVTTYALVLPAITMETEAQCGIEAHQHSDECYTEELVCEIPETPGHSHSDVCYELSQVLVCETPEHKHSVENGCYDEDGNLICELAEHHHTEDDGCYKEVKELVCDIPESEGHTHDSSCYKKVLTCGKEVHTHSTACYHIDAASKAATEVAAVASTESAAIAGTDSMMSTKASTTSEAVAFTDNLSDDEIDESNIGTIGSGTSTDLENVDTTSTDADAAGADPGGESGTWTPAEETVDSAVSETNGGAEGSTASAASSSATSSTSSTASTTERATEENAGYVHVLEELNINAVINNHTGIYYYHPESDSATDSNEASTEDSDGTVTADNNNNTVAVDNNDDSANTVTDGSAIPAEDWHRIPDNTEHGETPELGESDLLRIYLAYTIPAGSLNETNTVTRYRLPANIRLSDDQIDTINSTVNGIAAQYVNMDTLEILDVDQYNASLGIEAVEGTRTPDHDIQDYLNDLEKSGKEASEYINATVRVENVFNENSGDYEGQDLVFTFTPYSILKNQHEYDKDGQPTKAGEELRGWVSFDLTTDQIEWITSDNGDDNDDKEAVEKTADIVFVEKDQKLDVDEISTELKLVEKASADDIPTEKADAVGTAETTEVNETEAFMDEEKEDNKTEATEDDETAENEKAVEEPAVNYPSVSFDDSITVTSGTLSTDTTGAGAEENTEITVHVEADEDTFPEGTTMRLAAVTDDQMAAVTEAVEGAMAEAAGTQGTAGRTQGFHALDISFWNADGIEIEPLKPIRVSMTSEAIKRAVEDSATAPVVVHVEDGHAAAAGDSVDEDAAASEESVVEPADDSQIAATSSDSETVDDAEAGSQTLPTASIIETATGETKEENTDTLTFEAGAFSVYAIVYTVDFHYEVNGKMYEFSIPGGGFASFYKIVEVLGISNQGTQSGSGDENETENSEIEAGNGENTDEDDVYDVVEEAGVEDSSTYTDAISLNNIEVSEETKQFVADVASVEFSNPELVWVGKVEETTTVGGLKEANGLKIQYSAELTERQIEEINSSTVEPGDWALISVQPFFSEESLTVTMKNGDQFVIEVTDAQIQERIISASGSTYVITVTYGRDAQIPDGAELKVREIASEEEDYLSARQEIKTMPSEEKEKIPSHPMLFDISIFYEGHEIEPAEGSEVQVDVKLVGNTLKGMYTDEDSPLLVNDMPVTNRASKMEKQVQVLHLANDDQIDVVETEDVISEKEITSSFTTGSFSNWLLYLDEDLTSIDVTTGDSLTLRPYTEWVWKQADEPEQYAGGQWTFPTTDWNVTTSSEGGVNYTIYTHKTNGSSFRSFSKTDSQLNETYTVVTSVSLSATNGGFDLKTNKGKTIHVNVTQGAASGKPDTVQGISGLAVNLFDYDVPNKKNSSGQTIQNTFDFTKSGDLDVNTNVASNTNDNNNINTNHDLKFLGYGGSNTTNEQYLINNYTNANPGQGIVKTQLGADGFPELTSYTTTAGSWWNPSTVVNERQNPSLSYLFDTSSKDHNVYAFPNADGLFQRDNQGYYYYNSNVNYAEYNQATNRFVLYEHTYSQNTGGSNGANAKPIGFFPFHEFDTGNTQPEMNFNKNLNHHFGMSMEVEFEIPKDRKAPDDDGFKHDIIYEFSGDDDLWVFVDDKLVLDIGGIHQPVTGSINFTTGVIKVHGVDDKTTTFSVGPHKMKMFYIERGGCDSNLSVRFNLPLIIGRGNMRIAKKSMTTDNANQDSYLPGAVFGIWEDPNCVGDPYTVATSDRYGIIFKNLPIREEGQKYYLKEISPPEGYLLDSTIYTMTAAGKDSNGEYTFELSNNGSLISDTDSTYGYPIIRNRLHQPISIGVHKTWQSADGTTIAPESLPADLTAKFVVKRFRTYSTDPYLTVNLKSDAAGAVLFATISAYAGDVLTICYEHAPGGTTAYGTANGQRVLTLPTNSDGSEISVNYTVSAQHAVNDVIDIVIPQSFLDYCDGANYQGKNPEFDNIQLADHHTVREQDTVYNNNESSHEIVLPTAGNWSGSLNNLTVQEKINGVVYHYEYYVVEKEIPEGFEAIFLDSNGNPVADPASQAATENNTQDVINRELLDVPVEKQWADFSGEAYNWEATFQLDHMEVKVNSGDPDAPDAVTTGFVPIAGKVMTIEKGQSPVPKFENLPMYRVHDNGTVYRILYSVVEIGYTVKRNGTIVAQWGKDANGNNLQVIGDTRFEPQFEQDAGEHGSSIDDYIIKIVNVMQNRKLSKEIDLTVQKTWPEGSAYATDPDAYATFALKRYVHEEHRDYSNVDAGAEWVTITLKTWQNDESKDQKITVPLGNTVHIMGNILPKTNANQIAFSQGSGGNPITLIQNNPAENALPFDILVTADQTKTITLTQGDNYVAGGRDGFRLSDYQTKGNDIPDNTFGIELADGSHGEVFTLNQTHNWSTAFEYLPLVEEQDIDPKTGAQTIYVFSYYLEELECNPADFYPVFKDGNGKIVGGGSNNRIDYSTALTAENRQMTTDITLKKVAKDQLDTENPPTLKGAAFKIERYTSNTYQQKDTSWGTNGEMALTDVNSNGVFSFEGMTAGFYKIVETACPDGYVKISEDPVFEVRLNGTTKELEVILLNSDITDAANNQTEMVRVNDMTILFGNEPGAALPNTGGSGTNMIYLFGIMLTGLAGAGLVMRRKRKAA